MTRGVLLGAVCSLLPAALAAQAPPDWRAIEADAVKTLQAYVRLDTSNPPGDVTKAADFLAAILRREGIPFKRYEPAPGRSILLARLKGGGTAKALLLLHHMDVVPADASRWQRPPFSGDIADGRIWGRGAMDMKGIGVAQLYAFLELKRQHVPLARDVLLMAVPDEEVGGGLGAQWMRKNHYDELDPEYILDEGGVGSPDLFAPGKLVFGISVAEKRIMWLKLRVEGVAGHGSQPHDRNPNDRLVRALTRLLAEPLPPASFSVLDTMKSRVGALASNTFNNAIQRSTISLTSLRSGVGEPPKVNVIPSVAEATLDCRVMPGTTPEEWLAFVRQGLGDPAVAIEVINRGEDPVVTTGDSAFYRALESAVTRHHPGAIVTPMVVPYGTDSNGFRPLGVKAYGFAPLVVPAAAIASMHGDAEFLPADALGPAIQIIFEAVRDTARQR